MEERQHRDAADELERLVARIRATGPGPLEPAPSPEAIAAVLAHAGHEQPMSGQELDEHERMWRAVDAEIQAIERGDSSAVRPV